LDTEIHIKATGKGPLRIYVYLVQGSTCSMPTADAYCIAIQLADHRAVSNVE